MRKTNLFYTNGVDSKFLTFSNYTESLTGNFISTDTKIFPSKFLCIEAKENDQLTFNKQAFINLLIRYYENKLAVLRDNCLYHNEKCEDSITPLAYLLKTLDMYFGEDNWKVTYYGDITEQDFNGTYTDTICVIDSGNDFYKQSHRYGNNTNERDEKYANIDDNDTPPALYTKENNKTNLYNWRRDDLNTFFSTIHNNENEYPVEPIFDTDNYGYKFCEESLYYLEFKKNFIYNSTTTDTGTIIENENNEEQSQIRFNIVIPLFDVTNMNYHANDVMIDNLDHDTEMIDLRNDAYRKNVPLGIWFADEPIVLKKDIKTGFAQTWSLVISSQFKPFPYAKMQVNETNDMSNSNAFPTFAMVLSKQNQILEKFNYLESLIINQQKQIDSLQSQVKNTLSASNVDNIKKNFIKYQYDMNEKFNKLKQTVLECIDNLRWNGTE